MAITFDTLKNATIDDVKNNYDLSRALGTLFYGSPANADNLLRFWSNGIRNFSIDKNYIINGILGAKIFNKISPYLNRYNQYTSSGDASLKDTALVQQQLASSELNNYKQLLSSAGIDPITVPMFSFLNENIGTVKVPKNVASWPSLQAGDLFKSPTDDRVYLITPDNKKVWIDDPSKLTSLYGNDAWSRVKILPPDQSSMYPIDTEYFNTVIDENKSPFFNGRYGLVQFTDLSGQNTPTISNTYLVDNTDKTIRSFSSPEAFSNFFKGELTFNDAVNNDFIFKTNTAALSNPNNSLSNFKLTGSSDTVQNTGNYSGMELNVNTSKLSSLYGKTANASAITNAMKYLNGWLDWAIKNPDSGISSDLISSVKSNIDLMSFYASAVAFGEYSLPDILRDLKRRELIKQGRTDLNNVVVIDPEKPKGSYYSTNDGVAAKSNKDINIPNFFGDIPMEELNLSIYNLPSRFTDILVKPFDLYSPEGKKEMEKIQSAYHDVLKMQYEAKTEREKAIADGVYNEYRRLLDENYGIQLSSNALSAWSQIQNITKTSSELGALPDEEINNYLRKQRLTDQSVRLTHLDTEDKKKAEYYQTKASPGEISKLTEEEKVKYGLKPSESALKMFSFDNLKAAYPNLTDEQIKRMSTSLIDDSGNYRSTLYQTLYDNKMTADREKEVYQASVVTTKNAADAENAANDVISNIEASGDKSVTPPTTPPVTPSVTPPVETPKEQVTEWTPPANAQYERKEGSNDVYETTTGHKVTHDEAMKSNIWSQVKDIPVKSTQGSIILQTPPTPQTPQTPASPIYTKKETLKNGSVIGYKADGSWEVISPATAAPQQPENKWTVTPGLGSNQSQVSSTKPRTLSALESDIVWAQNRFNQLDNKRTKLGSTSPSGIYNKITGGNLTPEESREYDELSNRLKNLNLEKNKINVSTKAKPITDKVVSAVSGATSYLDKMFNVNVKTKEQKDKEYQDYINKQKGYGTTPGGSMSDLWNKPLK